MTYLLLGHLDPGERLSDTPESKSAASCSKLRGIILTGILFVLQRALFRTKLQGSRNRMPSLIGLTGTFHFTRLASQHHVCTVKIKLTIQLSFLCCQDVRLRR